MALTVFTYLILFLVGLFTSTPQEPQGLRDGDIIFQQSQSSTAQAIQIATHSRYSHMGMIFLMEEDTLVFEAGNKVTLTPFREFVNRGAEGHYVIKRLKNTAALDDPMSKATMKATLKLYEGREYDIFFEWTDDRLYCSELIWKMYKKSTGLDIGELRNLGDFDLTHPLVKQKLNEYFGEDIPMEEKVISPESIFQSPLLELVEERN